jgi:hypothetical protein
VAIWGRASQWKTAAVTVPNTRFLRYALSQVLVVTFDSPQHVGDDAANFRQRIRNT